MILITLKDMVWGLDEAGTQLSLHPQKEALDLPRMETEWRRGRVQGQGQGTGLDHCREGRGLTFEGLLLLLMVGTGLAGALLGTVLVGILWSGTEPVGTLGGTVPTRVELMGNLDGARLVSTLVGVIPEGFELVGNLEGTVPVLAEWGGTLEGAGLVVTELLGTPTPLVQMVASPWSPAPHAEGKPVEEEEVPVDRGDSGVLGKELALGVERGRA